VKTSNPSQKVSQEEPEVHGMAIIPAVERECNVGNNAGGIIKNWKVTITNMMKA